MAAAKISVHVLPAMSEQGGTFSLVAKISLLVAPFKYNIDIQ